MTRFLLLLSLCAVPSMAAAHSWFDPWCCNGGDSAEIPGHAVRVVPGGYQVTLVPGDHPMVTKPHTFFIEQAKAKPAEDGEYHACLWPTEDTLRCLYKPSEAF